jgi:hypothetical protein
MTRNEIAKRDQALAKQEQARTEQQLHNWDWIAADCSGSMASPAFEGKSRINCLREAVKPYAGRVQVLAFGTLGPNELSFVQADEIPNACAGTPMSAAIKKLAELEPLHILIVSDGQPTDSVYDEQEPASRILDSKSSALHWAKKLADQCVIDVMYIGPENADAQNFMQELARTGRGRYVRFDMNVQSPLMLSTTVGKMLALPAPGAIEL